MIKIDICGTRRLQLPNAALRVESADSGTDAAPVYFSSPCHIDACTVTYIEIVYWGSHCK